MLPVVAMWGQRCGLDMTATTAMPEAVRTGLARSLEVGSGGQAWGGEQWAQPGKVLCPHVVSTAGGQSRAKGVQDSCLPH